MSSLPSPLEHASARADRELASRKCQQLGRYIQRSDLSTAQRAEAAAQLDECERECAMLDERSGWSMSRFASEHDSAEHRPYQDHGHV